MHGLFSFTKETKDVVKHEENRTSVVGPKPLDIATTSPLASQEAYKIPSSDVTNFGRAHS